MTRPRRDAELAAGTSAHYEDPAYYTKTYRDRVHDVRFYADLAAARGGPVLEYGCGNGRMDVLESGLVDKLYNLWERNPITVRASYLASNGRQDAPPRTKLPSY